MRSALKLLIIAVLAGSGAACHKQQPQDQNIVVTNDVLANADIETLPPDESVGTPADQLANGSDNADVSDLNASANAY